MMRSVDISLKFCTAAKRKALRALVTEYRIDVNFFCKSLWNTRGKLDGETKARRVGSRLTSRYVSRAQKHALGMVIATRKALAVTKKYGSIPVFAGPPLLDASFINISLDNPSKAFDLFVKVSSLRPGHRLTLPCKRTKVLNKWLAVPGATLRQGCALGDGKLTLFVDVPTPTVRKTGKRLGIDIGMTDLIATSDGQLLNKDWSSVMSKLRRSHKGSKAFARHQRERTNVVNRIINQLPWADLSLLAVEDLTGMKIGKTANRSRAFRRARAPWVYRQVLSRTAVKCEENGVLQHAVCPRNTSRECPECGTVSKENRKGKQFRCCTCGHARDADVVGGVNILSRAVKALHLPVCREPAVPDATKQSVLQLPLW